VHLRVIGGIWDWRGDGNFRVQGSGFRVLGARF
jgi:hypothetical protein